MQRVANLQRINGEYDVPMAARAFPGDMANAM
jgi:hypothetical protein